MTIPFPMVAERIMQVLMSGGHNTVQMYDGEGSVVFSPKKARKFFTSPDNVMVSIHENNNDEETSTIKVSLSEGIDIKRFEETVGSKLRSIAAKVGDNMSYEIRTFGKILTPKDFAHETVDEDKGSIMKDLVNEKNMHITGTTRSSYQKVGECKLIIRHSMKVDENKHGARSRNIHAIFIETKGGERFRVTENNLHGARAMARHLSNGGSPFDTVGLKVSTMMGEMSELKKLAKETRSLKDAVLSEDRNKLLEQIKLRFRSIRESLKKLSGKVGYFKHYDSINETAGMSPTSFSDPLSELVFKMGKWLEKDKTDPTALGENEWVLWSRVADKLGHGENIIDPDEKNVMAKAAFKIGVPQFYNKLDELRFTMEEHLDTVSGEVQSLWASTIAKLRKWRTGAAKEKLTREEVQVLHSASSQFNINLHEQIEESADKMDTKKVKVKDVGVNEDELTVFGRDLDAMISADTDSLNSVNSYQISKTNTQPQKDYGVLPETKMLESWFDMMSNVEFFKEDELELEDDFPVNETSSSETALHNLNLYLGHPLFSHYMNLYNSQDLIETVLDDVQEDSKLWSAIREFDFDASAYTNDEERLLDLAFEQLRQQTSSERRESIEAAIERIASELVNDHYDGDEKAKEIASQKLWSRAEKEGLIRHDLGSEFADQSLTKPDSISTDKDEISAETHYGDASYHEEGLGGAIAGGLAGAVVGGPLGAIAGSALGNKVFGDDDDDDTDESFEEVTLPEIFADQGAESGATGTSYVGDEVFVLDPHGGEDQEGTVVNADGEQVSVELHNGEIISVHNSQVSPRDEDKFDDSMDGDHESALGSAGMGTDEYYGDHGNSYESKNELNLSRLVELSGINKKELTETKFISPGDRVLIPGYDGQPDEAIVVYASNEDDDIVVELVHGGGRETVHFDDVEQLPDHHRRPDLYGKQMSEVNTPDAGVEKKAGRRAADSTEKPTSKYQKQQATRSSRRAGKDQERTARTKKESITPSTKRIIELSKYRR